MNPRNSDQGARRGARASRLCQRTDFPLGLPPGRAAGLFSVFRAIGIWENSQSWIDYERGKQRLLRMNLTPDEYEGGIKALTEYLCL